MFHTSYSVYLNIVLLACGLMLVTWVSHQLVERLIDKEVLQKFYSTSSVIFQVLGSIAGIMQAFVVVSFWNDFQDVSNSAHQEVETISVTYRNISLLNDSPQKVVLMNDFKNYVFSLIKDEVAGHEKGHIINTKTQGFQNAFWDSLQKLAPTIRTPGEQAIFQSLIQDANASAKLRQHRLNGLSASDASLLWVVLITSAFIVMSVMGTLSVGQKGRIYYLQCFAMASIFSLMIAVSLDYSKPYEGTATISKSIYDAILKQVVNLL